MFEIFVFDGLSTTKFDYEAVLQAQETMIFKKWGVQACHIMPWPGTHHNEGDLDESWFWGDKGEDLSLIKVLDMARGSVATAIHSNERSAVIRLSAEKEY